MLDDKPSVFVGHVRQAQSVTCFDFIHGKPAIFVGDRKQQRVGGINVHALDRLFSQVDTSTMDDRALLSRAPNCKNKQ